jgi:hypothetical protein
MHDIDRTLGEFEGEMYETGEFEFEAESGSVFDEATELELTAELLEVSNEAELEQFLGDLIKKAGSAIGKFARSPVGNALGGILKGAAKAALPVVGGALGTLVGGPAGGALGGTLAQKAGDIFGLELEGLSGEDREFESARAFTKFGGEAAKNAALAPPNADPQAAAKAAAVAAAKKFAPGLLAPTAPQNHHPIGVAMANGTHAGDFSAAATGVGGRRSGRWYRRGNRIVLLGV